MSFIDDIKLLRDALLPDNSNQAISAGDLRQSQDLLYDNWKEISSEETGNTFDFSTYALMTVSDGILNVVYKVSNDPDSSKNGYYHWNGSDYIKDADLTAETDARIDNQGTFINLDIVDPEGTNYTLITALAKLNDSNSESYKFRKAGMFITFTALEDNKTIQRTYQHLAYKEPNVFNESYNWVDVTFSGLSSLLDNNDFILISDSIINSNTGAATDADLIGVIGWTVLMMKVDEDTEEVIVNNNYVRWYCFYEEHPFVNSNAILPRKSVRPYVKPKGAKYFLCTFQDSQNPQGYSNIIAYQRGVEKADRAVHDNSTNVLQIPSEIKTGYFIDSDGNEVANSSMAYDKYIINSNIDKYFLKSEFTSSGYTGIDIAIFYNNSDVEVGRDGEVVDGEVLYTDFMLRMPKDASYFIINRQINGVGEVYEYSNDYIDVNLIKESVNTDSLKGKVMKVWFDDDYFYVRSKYDDNEDLIIRMNINRPENNISPNYTWRGLSNKTDKEILSEDYIHDFTDSTAPFWMDQYWYLFAQHGYLIPQIECTHNKDSSDIGSTWQDNTGRNFELVRVVGSDLYFAPPIILGTPTGKDTREWRVPSDNDAITGFTHVSGAIHTDPVTTITNKKTAQVDPIQNSENRKFTADKKEISDFNKVYYCNDFTASETLSCINPVKVTQWYPTVEHEATDYEMCRITQSFNFSGASCAVNTILDSRYPIDFNHYGASQTKTLVPVDGYDSFAIIPKVLPQTFGGVSNVDFRKPFNTSNWETNGAITFYRDASYLEDVNDLPDRMITWLENTGTGQKGLGLATGLSLITGITQNTERLSYIPEGTGYTNQALYYSPVNHNKFYVRAIEGSAFADSLLPTSFIKEINYYWSYFDPAQQLPKVYSYKDGNDYILYIHHDAVNSKLAVKVPEYMEGLKAAIIEKTTGAELITNTVQNGIVYISLDSDPNYLVLKFN